MTQFKREKSEQFITVRLFTAYDITLQPLPARANLWTMPPNTVIYALFMPTMREKLIFTRATEILNEYFEKALKYITIFFHLEA